MLTALFQWVGLFLVRTGFVGVFSLGLLKLWREVKPYWLREDGTSARKGWVCGLKKTPAVRGDEFPPLGPAEFDDGVGVTIDVLVIGAGPAGLAMAANLRRFAPSLSFVVVDRAPEVCSSWRTRYDRLRLNTAGSVSHLVDGISFPPQFGVFPCALDVVAYCESLVKLTGIEPHLRLGFAVRDIVPAVGVEDRAGARWKIRIAAEQLEMDDDTLTERDVLAKTVIMCTGQRAIPKIPRLPGLDNFRGKVLHSSVYRNGSSLGGKDVIVVGFGGSGAEIALDLAEHGARPTIYARSPVNIMPRWLVHVLGVLDSFDILGIGRNTSARALAIKDMVGKWVTCWWFGDLSAYGIQFPHPSIGMETALVRQHRPPMVDIGTVDAVKAGVIRVVKGRVSSFSASGMVLEDGEELQADAVILATGFEQVENFSRILPADVMEAVVSPEHNVVSSGVETVRGLYFVGCCDRVGRFLEIRRETKHIAKELGYTSDPPGSRALEEWKWGNREAVDC